MLQCTIRTTGSVVEVPALIMLFHFVSRYVLTQLWRATNRRGSLLGQARPRATIDGASPPDERQGFAISGAFAFHHPHFEMDSTAAWRAEPGDHRCADRRLGNSAPFPPPTPGGAVATTAASMVAGAAPPDSAANAIPVSRPQRRTGAGHRSTSNENAFSEEIPASRRMPRAAGRRRLREGTRYGLDPILIMTVMAVESAIRSRSRQHAEVRSA